MTVVFRILKSGLMIWWNHTPAEFCRRLSKVLPTSRKRYNNIKRINLCGGAVNIDGYVNIDKSSNADIVHNLLNPLPIVSNTVEVIFISHGLNYFTKKEIPFVLSECCRILKKRGIIRILVPDLEIFAREYIERNYGFYFQKTAAGNDRFIGETFGEKFASLAYEYGHKYMLDYEITKGFLLAAGFSEVKKCNYCESNIPEVLKLDNRPEISLFVEAIK